MRLALPIAAALAVLTLCSLPSSAGVPSPSPAPLAALASPSAPAVGVPVTVAAASASDDSAPLPAADFFAQVLQAIQKIGGVGKLMAISLVLTLLVSSTKVSFLNELVWSKLGALQVFVAPVLSAIAGVLGLGSNGAPLTLALVFAYLLSGGGAVYIHQVLDALKALPGLGSMYVALIEIVSKALGGPAPAAVDSKKA